MCMESLSFRDENSVEDIRRIIREKAYKPHIIHGMWIRDSIDNNKTVEERPYHL